jgi:hypothetical protein
MFNCSAINIDVRSFSNFNSVSLPNPMNANGSVAATTFSPGNPGDVVVVRLMYQWPIYASALAVGLVNSSNNTNLLVATAAFRNEPY